MNFKINEKSLWASRLNIEDKIMAGLIGILVIIAIICGDMHLAIIAVVAMGMMMNLALIKNIHREIMEKNKRGE